MAVEVDGALDALIGDEAVAERAEMPWPLIKRIGELGIVGEDIDEYGCAGLSPIACGLVPWNSIGATEASGRSSASTPGSR
jgi:hypothetical protein